MLKRNLFFLFTITLFGIISLVLCIYNYNPYLIGVPQFIYFYSSLFISLIGILSIIIFYIRVALSKKETIYVHFWPSIRLAFIVSLSLTSLLILKGLNLLDWWVGIPLIIIAALIELFFQTKKSR